MIIPVIAIIKDNELTDEELKSPPYCYLKELHDKKKIKLDSYINPKSMDIGEALTGKYSAVLCRPLWGGEINLEHINKLRKDNNKPFFIATLSAGTSHIKIDKQSLQKNNIEIICSDGGNADQTAEMTMYMAISLRRRLHFDIMNMAFGNNSRSESKYCKSLRNCTWTTVGHGHVVQSLVRRLVGLGLHRIIVWNHRMTLDIFQKVFSNVGVVSWVSRSNRKPCAVVGASGTGPSCLVEGTMDWKYALRDTDVVSIHVPLIPQDEDSGKGGTENLINEEKIKVMKKEAVIINAARHGIVKEEDVIKALVKEELFGFGSDVLEKNAEKEGADPQESNSLLWQAYCYNLLKALTLPEQEEMFANIKKYYGSMEEFKVFADENDLKEDQVLNILLTPHLGGWTHEAEEDIATEVIGELLIKLGLGKHVDFYTSPKTPSKDKDGVFKIEGKMEGKICQLSGN